MNASEFANRFDHPVVFFASAGAPAGTEVAILPETDLPFDLSEIEVDIDGRWDGQGSPTDWKNNAVTKITVCDDKEIWTDQAEEAGGV